MSGKIMTNIAEVVHLSFSDDQDFDRDKQVTRIFEGTRHVLVDVRLRNGAILTKHKASEPISVLCLAGAGVFRAGPELVEEQRLSPGTLLMLEADVEHEVAAEPSLHILVTRFRSA